MKYLRTQRHTPSHMAPTSTATLLALTTTAVALAAPTVLDLRHVGGTWGQQMSLTTCVGLANRAGPGAYLIWNDNDVVWLKVRLTASLPALLLHFLP